MRRLFGCPDIVSLTEKFLMARNFFRIFTENNPVMGYSKTFVIPEAKGLSEIMVQGRANIGQLVSQLSLNHFLHDMTMRHLFFETAWSIDQSIDRSMNGLLTSRSFISCRSRWSSRSIASLWAAWARISIPWAIYWSSLNKTNRNKQSCSKCI